MRVRAEGQRAARLVPGCRESAHHRLEVTAGGRLGGRERAQVDECGAAAALGATWFGFGFGLGFGFGFGFGFGLGLGLGLGLGVG